ncbi:hypothetical protein HNR73_004517 [Phytomonospora endophytica]|uniref:Uncharacterized protein n=1 Tax=Phytomonospora endophytica TaxID=714109 RepID=A0A841FKF7_9ACTN|nr:hypothetical protein [Phytomonospora endophytica]GIG65967.1 hypothetical protein Pen01_22620 [Phytomonospora endophytica]
MDKVKTKTKGRTQAPRTGERSDPGTESPGSGTESPVGFGAKPPAGTNPTRPESPALSPPF